MDKNNNNNSKGFPSSLTNWFSDFKFKSENRQDIKELQIKLDSQFSDLDETFTKLGKEFYSSKINNDSDDLTEIISDIQNKENNISLTEKELHKMQGVKKCEKCGALIGIQYIFCGMCGTPLPADEIIENEANLDSLDDGQENTDVCENEDSNTHVEVDSNDTTDIEKNEEAQAEDIKK